MGVSWTEEQLQVISHRNQNLLVSAAAGSGKTAVLVERILSRILDPEDPVNIDELLIVTFTRAAAGEMRERIGASLTKALEKDPENEHLQRQQTLLHHAQINTIHGFCSYVIKNYFTLIGLDPAYRMGDEGEMQLLRQDIIAGVLEEAYEKAEPDFLHFVECYASGKKDSNLEEMILDLSTHAESNPWPEQFYENAIAVYEMNPEELEQSALWKELQAETGRLLADIRQEIRETLYLIEQPDGPEHYRGAIEADLVLAEELCALTGFDEIRACLMNLKWKTLGRAKKDSGASEYLITQVKNRRDSYKKKVTGLRDDFYQKSREEIQEQLFLCQGPMRTLIKLAKTYDIAYQEEKRRKNILDYSDLEHLALKILVEKQEDGTICPTPAAREIASGFREIMTDEYQDSNLIQEVLLSAVSGHGEGLHNRFMVGDIKQSIYGFRLARPELFLEKYHLYRVDPAEGCRIDLAKNFRSRSEVLTSVNYLFEQLMCTALGGIAYDADAALYTGASYPENPVSGENSTEILLIRSGSDNEETEESPGAKSDLEVECYAVAEKIRSLVGRMEVTDKKTGEFRKARYGDIVILLRAVAGWAEPLQQILSSMEIPSYATTRTGYFETTEIATILDYLKVCDNPMQDIPLAAVLYSPIGGFDEKELADLRAAWPGGNLYQALKQCAEKGQGILREKSQSFLAMLNQFRNRVPYTPIHLLLEQVLEETGYMSFACAMPAGEQRRANLEMLIEKAKSYETTSYHGLFHFVRYMENLRNYKVDYGEVNINGENTDAVRIMTIHKSKGLEFPIVFLCGMGKQFNLRDVNRPLVTHAAMGLGADAIDPELRVKEKTLPGKMIRKLLTREMLAEELRVLYVALTRAKEKLILTGIVKKTEDRLIRCSALASCQKIVLPFGTLTGARSYLDWILAALARSDAFLPLYKAIGFFPDRRPEQLKCPGLPLRLAIISPEQLVEEELFRQMEQESRRSEILQQVDSPITSPEFAETIRSRFDYRYPWEHLMRMPAKISVSELKRAGMDEEEEGTPLVKSRGDREPYIPSFVDSKRERKLTGAERGTAYHLLLKELFFEEAHSDTSIEAQLKELIARHKMTQNQAACIEPEVIRVLAESPLGRRMEMAQKQRKLYTEKPFVLGVSAALADPAWPQKEQLMVQGMIDVWIEEIDGLVLVDYKTDWVTTETREILVSRYEKQLFYYKMALEQLTGRKVKEVHIYSLTLGEDLLLDL